jgi:uncharacterized LabA/DUF88 family protein
VDWNAQLLLTGRDVDAEPERAAEAAFKQTTRRIARCLAGMDSNRWFRVSLRLYHGWHKGFEPTINRKAVQLVIGSADYATLSQRENVIFLPNVEFGDRLMNALDRRLHPRLGIHLPNTLRRRYREDVEEKMVDTALAADMVSVALTELSDWMIVLTEDDDLIPPVYVAEAALRDAGGRVVILRQRAHHSMPNLDDLLVRG